MHENHIYLDNASTTRIDSRVLEAMLPFFGSQYGNPSSIHATGRQAKAAIEQAREHVAMLFDALPSEIVFTSGGTEAINFAIKGAMKAARLEGKNEIITSRAEHHAVLKTCEYLDRTGIQTTFLPVTGDGIIDSKDLENALTKETALISLMHVNNETGAINEMEKIACLTKERGVFFHTDTVQSAGKIPLSSKNIPYDFAVASAHKIHGPKGIGALFVRAGIGLEPLIHGGAQERGRRGGTESVPLIVGFGEAARLAIEEREERMLAWRKLRSIFLEIVQNHLRNIIINGSDAEILPNIISISFPSMHYPLDGEALLINLDLEGVAVSSGSACTAGSVEPSHVMIAAGHDRQTSAATMRFSFGRFTTEEEVRIGVNALIKVVQQMLDRK